MQKMDSKGDYISDYISEVFAMTSYVLGSSGFMAGKKSTSLMLLESVRNMASLSMPMPHPPVGGSPYSRAVQKFSSMNIASSSPLA